VLACRASGALQILSALVRILSEIFGPILISLPVALDPRLVPITSSWCIVTSFDRILALI